MRHAVGSLVAVTEQKEALEVELATSVAGAARLELITSAITARLREQLAALAAGGLTTTEERRHYAALQELLAYQEQLRDAPDEQLPERSRPTVARPLPGTPDGAAAGAVAAVAAGAPRPAVPTVIKQTQTEQFNWSSSTGEVMLEAAHERAAAEKQAALEAAAAAAAAATTRRSGGRARRRRGWRN